MQLGYMLVLFREQGSAELERLWRGGGCSVPDHLVERAAEGGDYRRYRIEGRIRGRACEDPRDSRARNARQLGQLCRGELSCLLQVLDIIKSSP